MQKNIILQKKVKLMNNQFLVYLKEVATRIGKNGKTEATTVRAFIKKI